MLGPRERQSAVYTHGVDLIACHIHNRQSKDEDGDRRRVLRFFFPAMISICLFLVINGSMHYC